MKQRGCCRHGTRRGGKGEGGAEGRGSRNGSLAVIALILKP